MDSIASVFEFVMGDKKLYWLCAIFGSALFIIQLGLALLGMGDHGDIDADTGGLDMHHADTGISDFRFFSFRSVVAFITFFGWGGVIFGLSGIAGFFAALTSGLIMMLATAALLCFLLKMEQSGNINPEDYVGSSGKVYLGIPAGRGKTGKVSVSIRGSLREIDGVSDEEIPTGVSVKVVECVDGQRFLVKRI